MSFISGIFGFFSKPPEDPEKVCKDFIRKTQRHANAIERDVQKVLQKQKESRNNCKKYVKEGQLDAARLTAKNIHSSEKEVLKMQIAKSHLDSTVISLKLHSTSMKLSKVMGKSTEVFKSVNSLFNMPLMRQSIADMAREMEKAGLVEAMVDDAFDAALGDVDEAAVSAEEERVIQEILNEATTGTRAAPTSNLPSGVATAAATSQPTQADREWAALQANEAKL